MLDADTIKGLQEKLLTLQSELTGLAETDAAAASVELDQSRVGRLSRMDALAGAAMNAETKRRRVLQLKMITQALQRIENNNYGECQNCFEFINPDRLEHNPAASLCIVCATKEEKRKL